MPTTPKPQTDHTSGLRILCGRGFFPPGVSAMLRDHQRFGDICGPSACAVIDLTGWRYTGTPRIALAKKSPRGAVQAAGWAAPIRWTDGTLGVNLAYAVSPHSSGQALSEVCTSAAFLTLCKETPAESLGKVNIQCHEGNAAAIRIAERMGFRPYPSANFRAERIDRNYLGFAIEADRFKAVAEELLSSRLNRAELCVAA